METISQFDTGRSIKKKKRPVEVLILSDIHLGTYGCRAKELHRYLKSIKPEKVILNGDIIDMWQFSKRYFPKSHMRILNKILKWVKQGVEVHYLTGNHDEVLRKFSGISLGSLTIADKLLLELDGSKIWIFHGDVFDVTMKHSKWLTKIGAHGYDILILINTLSNWISERLGRGRISFSKTIKNKVKSAVKFINSFEQVCAEIAIDNNYDAVICGHIHHPEIKQICSVNGNVMYMNSGDWVENMTALEYHEGKWTIYHHTEHELSFAKEDSDEDDNEHETVLMNTKDVFNKMYMEMSNQHR